MRRWICLHFATVKQRKKIWNPNTRRQSTTFNIYETTKRAQVNQWNGKNIHRLIFYFITRHVCAYIFVAIIIMTKNKKNKNNFCLLIIHKSMLSVMISLNGISWVNVRCLPFIHKQSIETIFWWYFSFDGQLCWCVRDLFQWFSKMTIYDVWPSLCALVHFVQNHFHTNKKRIQLSKWF